MVGSWFASIRHFGSTVLQKVQDWIKAKTKPTASSQVLGTAADLLRGKAELVAENALLRQQLIVLNRSVKHPKLTGVDRGVMVLLSSKLAHWKQALLIVQPDTLLRWHRAGFRLYWRTKSAVRTPQQTIPVETIALIKQMATENRTWGCGG